MKQQVFYRYLGTNGIIESPVHLEDIYYVRLLHLTAADGKLLTNGESTYHSITIPESDLDKWTEIEDKGQE